MFTQKQIKEAYEELIANEVFVNHDEVERALKAAEAQAWQPIKTAPKDDDILLALPTRPDNPSEGSYCFSVACWDEAGWISEGCTYNAALPTHWRPLPPAPQT